VQEKGCFAETCGFCYRTTFAEVETRMVKKDRDKKTDAKKKPKPRKRVRHVIVENPKF
jgi:hypothetical protein